MAAKKKTTKKTGKKVEKGLLLSAGIATAAAAGYLLFGPKGKQNRTRVKAWTVKAKGEILEKMEKMDHMTEGKYEAIVAAVATKYAKAKDITKADVEKFAKEAKKHWKKIEKDHMPKMKKKAPAKKKPAAKKSSATKKKTTAKKPAAKKKTTAKKKK